MGALAGAIGRKKTIMALCLPLLIGWIIVGLSDGIVAYIYVGRVFQGIGIMSSVTQVYLVEVADDERR
jgi:MFS family permease